MKKPIIAITMGDPASIGPEIVIKSLTHPEIYEICKPLIIGDRSVIEKNLEFLKLDLEIKSINEPDEGIYKYGTLSMIDLNNVDVSKLKFGEVSAMSGKASYEYIVKSIELAMHKKVAAVATAPINKVALKKANVNFIGHTEIFGNLTHSNDPLTMFEIENEMRVFFLSRHVSLRTACDLVKKDRVLDYIIRCSEALKKIGISTDKPLGVAGLNPHAGDEGLFGREEIEEIIPAIEEAKKLGYNVVGPIGADSIFYLARKGNFSAVLSMYHDQGHIATKTLDFKRTISITLGMPILRTSVDHGTAFDIAGKGIADETSMFEAIKLAAKYSIHFIQ
ncbi:MAG: 4-phospho-D-threonate 3-dehydrogenase / 4-phospho-D-erythronate 3-dehydrogenase [Thermosipho sp. (in: thermotogales)]|uniref:4-hydroxythreonine-4-phosphate dehydrogenase PdxA n=1 Tax=Thermosipho sp. (in: thermotogales) TaxID=1968895 RepID=UPI00257BF8ED|nr:4-hydroxythreonine-4-phosphate dehydrogenase PdxA [Thermosipho sp. (in: thermotogales)]MBZ4649990.1 pdxA [Thermosipho sp. (in: thermotogales)]MDK2886625.1 4-phospho-D-threonate 3-dehydrogenase / 4-phospho-D-erythronate 3-dehydrogenase [Thermosipho sp. (in: thermotogales)]MDK2907473.1 4-phospho-D-threonate 3-dehydrogenase / 4-phospho-D-erythronate 3-dehydrogenase [Petrotoga sp.]MDK2946772.1 4-phospho-D-threonate 3-dehydrogenase / 4-phospho-D-erythronate 3-dehydrogenase [Geotoga sp.]